MADRAMQVWATLAEMYGQTLLSNFGAEPPSLWRAKIAELSDSQLANGLRVFSEKASQYPPTLGEFVSTCKGASSPRMLGQSLDDNEIRRICGPTEPARGGLPSGMSAIAYKAAEVRQSGMLTYIDDLWICASSLPPKHHKTYFSGKFENVREHRGYILADKSYRNQLEREFAFKWDVKVNLEEIATGWPA